MDLRPTFEHISLRTRKLFISNNSVINLITSFDGWITFALDKHEQRTFPVTDNTYKHYIVY